MKTLSFLTTGVALCGALSTTASASSFSFIYPTAGFDFTRPLGVSDGGKAVGLLVRRQGPSGTFSWTSDGGTIDWSAAGISSVAGNYGISGDGSVIVGTHLAAGASRATAFRRVGEGTLQNLGIVPTWQYSNGTLASADGSLVVGRLSRGVVYPDVRSSPFVWTQAGGMRDLGKLADAAECEATALSTDGSTVVGWSELNIGTTRRAPIVWRGSSPLSLLSLDGIHAGFGAEATGISGDGRIIVGYAADPDPVYARTAIQWIDGTPHQLPLVGDYLNNTARWITADARMIVGGVSGSASSLPSLPYVWFSQGGGMPLYDDWEQNGIQMPAGWQVMGLFAMSPDGNTFVGEMKQGTNGPTYGIVVTIPAPATCLVGVAFAFAVRRRRS